MNSFKKSIVNLFFAITISGVTLYSPAQAVNISKDNVGQTLIFPYYNTRGGWTSLYTITNVSNLTVLAKVRWREGVNGRSVSDFTIVLSPYDAWAVGVRDTGEGAGIFSPDNSCTFPKLPSLANIGSTEVTGIDFTNLNYISSAGIDNHDNGSTGLDRTKEGYFEVITMATISNMNENGSNAEKLAYNAKHKPAFFSNTAIPRSCDNVRVLLSGTEKTVTVNQLEAPQNVLKGEALLVNGANGIAAGYDPLALEDFAAEPIYFEPNNISPSLGDADPIVDGNTVASGQDAVSALISRSAVINNFNVAGDSQSSWVLTFPTKHFYVDRALATTNNQSPMLSGSESLAPFDDASIGGELFGLNHTSAEGKSCFETPLALWDREEFYVSPDELYGDALPLYPPSKRELCYETNIISFGDDNEGRGLFDSDLAVAVFDSVLPSYFGWAQITFGGTSEASLPVLGIKVEIRNRGDASVNFGFANDHAYKRISN